MEDRILDFFRERLELRGDTQPLSLRDSLFASGRLDSLDAMRTILFLEENFRVDFAGLDFSLELLDSAAAVVTLIEQRGS